jgi:hypothetical protein
MPTHTEWSKFSTAPSDAFSIKSTEVSGRDCTRRRWFSIPNLNPDERSVLDTSFSTTTDASGQRVRRSSTDSNLETFRRLSARRLPRVSKQNHLGIHPFTANHLTQTEGTGMPTPERTSRHEGTSPMRTPTSSDIDDARSQTRSPDRRVSLTTLPCCCLMPFRSHSLSAVRNPALTDSNHNQHHTNHREPRHQVIYIPMTPMESTAVETTFSPPFEDHVSNAR